MRRWPLLLPVALLLWPIITMAVSSRPQHHSRTYKAPLQPAAAGISHVHDSRRQYDMYNARFILQSKERYGQGLCNTLYTLICGLSLATAVGADFEFGAQYYHTDLQATSQQAMGWHEMPSGTIYNVQQMQRTWRYQAGINVYPDGFSTASPVEVKVVQLPGRGPFNMWVEGTLKAMDELDKQNKTGVVHKLHYTGVWANPGRHPVFAEALSRIVFARHIVRLANRVISQLRVHNGHYMGVHLRLEPDMLGHGCLAKDPDPKYSCSTPVECFNKAYKPTIEAAAANATTKQPIYIASGIFKADPSSATQIVESLTAYGSHIQHAHNLLADSDLKRLNHEELSAVNFLVMSHADTLIATRISTFSIMVSQHRLVHKRKGQTVFIPWIAPEHHTMFFFAEPEEPQFRKHPCG